MNKLPRTFAWMMAGMSGLALGGVAFAQERLDAEAVSNIAFSSVDSSGNGYVHQGDAEAYRELVFVSMDADDNGVVSGEEFALWGYGLDLVSDDGSKQVAYDTAKRILFHYWDRDRDGALTPSEHRHAITLDFRRADLDDDALLSEEEFVDGLSAIAVIRSALED